MKELDRLLWKVNRVTAYHRHGNPIPEQALWDLVDAQIEYERAVAEGVTSDSKQGLAEGGRR